MEFKESSATVKDAAIAIHCREGEIAKTLSFLVVENLILIVVAGVARIANHKYKMEFLTKTKMIPASEVEKLIGHAGEVFVQLESKKM